jgi:hypothetical protein
MTLPVEPRRHSTATEVLAALTPLVMIFAAWWIVGALGRVEDALLTNRATVCAVARTSEVPVTSEQVSQLCSNLSPPTTGP